MTSTNEDALSLVHEPLDPNAPVRWSDYTIDDYISMGIFWLLAADVIVQFFSRYVLNDSIGWTEEIARYLLILVTFVGGATAARKNGHIMVEFFYRYLNPQAGFALSTLVDLIKIVFFFWISWIAFGTAGKANQMMVAIDIPKSWVYYIVAVGLLWMGVRSVQAAIRHWKQGGSSLNRFDVPKSAIE